jgi:hypothetical protein
VVADGVRVSRVGATRLLRSLPALALAWPALAGAGPVAEPLASARAGLAEGDLKGAVKTVDAAVKALPEAAAVVEPAELAALFMVQGAAWHRRGEKYESKAMDSFRRALSTDGEVAWDRERLGEGADWTLFEALRDEVRSRPEVDPKVPEKTGAAQVFIDGVRVRAGDAVIQGTHLGQITCDDATVHGVWTALVGSTPAWWSRTRRRTSGTGSGRTSATRTAGPTSRSRRRRLRRPPRRPPAGPRAASAWASARWR